MIELRLSEIIRRRRKELNIPQEQLCMGICSRGTLSRFENGRLTLSYKRASALLQRLDLPDGRLYLAMSEDELALEKAEREARAASVALGRAPAEERGAAWAAFRAALERLEALGPDDPFVRQCVLSLRAEKGTEDGPCPFAERLAMQLEAIRLTMPQFDPDHIGLGPYSAEELRLILQLGSTYFEAQQYEKAMHIYNAGLEYLEANGQYMRFYSHLKPSFIAGLANALTYMGRYEEALEMAERGVLAGLEYKRFHKLDILLWIKAYCCYHLGRREECVPLYRQAYYVLLTTREMSRLQILKEEVRELLGMELEG